MTVRRFLAVVPLLLLAPSVALAISVSDNTWTLQSNPTKSLGSYNGSWVNRLWTQPVYDATGERVLLYEGYSCASCGDAADRPTSIYSNALWAYTADDNTLTLIKPGNWYNDSCGTYATWPLAANSGDPTPADRHAHLAYNVDDNEVLLGPGLNQWWDAAGVDCAGGNDHPDDVWTMALSGSSWAQATDTNRPEAGNSAVYPGVVYDQSVDKYVFAWPTVSAYSSWRTFLYDPAADSWSNWDDADITESIEGGYKGDNILAYDTRRALVWMYGGGDNNEIFSLDTSAEDWTVVTPNGTGPAAMAGESQPGFAYIPKYDVLVMLGGSGKNETWIYQADANAWIELSTATSPTAANWIDLAYDVGQDAVVALVGNSEGDGEFFLLRYKPFEDDASAHAVSAQSTPSESTWTLDVDYGGWFLKFKEFGASGYGHHVYANLQAFSKDNTYIALLSSDGTDVYNIGDDPTSNGTVACNNLNIGSTFYFAPDDDDVLYFFDGPNALLRKITISTCTASTVKDFSADFSQISVAAAQAPSADGRYFPILGQKTANSAWAMTRFDKTGDSYTTPIEGYTGALGSDSEIYMTWDGAYLIANRSVGLQQFDPVTGWVKEVRDTSFAPHMATVEDSSDSSQWIVFQDNSNCRVSKVAVADGTEVVLFQDGGECQNYHIGATHVAATDTDWVIVTSYASAANRADDDPWQQEIIRVYLDSTVTTPHVERMIHHRSYTDSAYWAQPHASVSPDGKWVIYGSNWEVQAEAETQVDPYIGWLPPTSSVTAASNGTTTIGSSGTPVTIGAGTPVTIQ